ncbi:hypothetical protein BDZ45DRAFT_41062 [Acephala macrosclerotiorum]|nr:hypothetical protein BDZ45DRAFT_41062 [Acephala macrosclerotiorum]
MRSDTGSSTRERLTGRREWSMRQPEPLLVNFRLETFECPPHYILQCRGTRVPTDARNQITMKQPVGSFVSNSMQDIIRNQSTPSKFLEADGRSANHTLSVIYRHRIISSCMDLLFILLGHELLSKQKACVIYTAYSKYRTALVLSRRSVYGLF